MSSHPKAQAASDGQPQLAAGSRFSVFLLPSLADLIFIVLFLAFSFGSLSPRLLWDADIGWHIRDGQEIIASHSIPHVDSFSATRSGQAWYAWEWLYDAAIGWIYNRSGLNGVVFISALVIAATLALLFRFTLRRGGNLPVSIVLFVLCTMASSIHFLARPHVVGWLTAVIWFWMLDTATRNGTNTRRLLWLPPLMLLWANLHGSFVLGFVLLGIYVLADCLKLLRCRIVEQRRTARKQASMLVVVGGLSFLASLINPYGIKLHIHVYQYLSDRFLMQHINEFQRPDLRGAPLQAFLVMIALTIVAILAARGRLRWADWLLILFSIFSGTYAARNLPVASMLLMMVTAPLLSQPVGAKTSLFARAERWGATELSLHVPVWSMVVVIASAFICLNHGRLLGRQLMKAHFDPSRFPVKAVDTLQQRGLREPIFSLDSWGGYLIYRLYPATKVFVDDRHDFYGEAYIRDYLKVIHVEQGWEKVLDGWSVTLIVLPSTSNLSTTLQHSPAWKMIYGDATAEIFQRGS